jgi:hypothetical protein
MKKNMHHHTRRKNPCRKTKTKKTYKGKGKEKGGAPTIPTEENSSNSILQTPQYYNRQKRENPSMITSPLFITKAATPTTTTPTTTSTTTPALKKQKMQILRKPQDITPRPQIQKSKYTNIENLFKKSLICGQSNECLNFGINKRMDFLLFSSLKENKQYLKKEKKLSEGANGEVYLITFSKPFQEKNEIVELTFNTILKVSKNH